LTALVAKPRFEGQKESKKQLGLILGIIGGFVTFVGIAGLFILLFLFILLIEFLPLHIQESRINIYARSIVPQLMRLPALGLPPYRYFTIEEIEDAKNNFDPSNLIGERSQRQTAI
jgi:hypothetical protein